jgi:proline dehydrogenase
LRREIVAGGHKLRVYLPFGEAWFAYSTRRLKENPDLVRHFIRDFFRKH